MKVYFLYSLKRLNERYFAQNSACANSDCGVLYRYIQISLVNVVRYAWVFVFLVVRNAEDICNVFVLASREDTLTYLPLDRIDDGICLPSLPIPESRNPLFSQDRRFFLDCGLKTFGFSFGFWGFRSWALTNPNSFLYSFLFVAAITDVHALGGVHTLTLPGATVDE
jgi:hypothetical protein